MAVLATSGDSQHLIRLELALCTLDGVNRAPNVLGQRGVRCSGDEATVDSVHERVEKSLLPTREPAVARHQLSCGSLVAQR
jgi:hypothetical protein